MTDEIKSYKCPYCGGVYETDSAGAVISFMFKHHLECKKHPLNVEITTLKAERDALNEECDDANATIRRLMDTSAMVQNNKDLTKERAALKKKLTEMNAERMNVLDLLARASIDDAPAVEAYKVMTE